MLALFAAATFELSPYRVIRSLYAAVCPAPARWVDDEDVVAVVGWVVGGICCWVKLAGAWKGRC